MNFDCGRIVGDSEVAVICLTLGAGDTSGMWDFGAKSSAGLTGMEFASCLYRLLCEHVGQSWGRRERSPGHEFVRCPVCEEVSEIIHL